jgi:hypothetical protein
MTASRWVGWFLACIFLFNSMGYVSVMLLARYRLKEEAERKVRTQLPDQALTLLKFDNPDASLSAQLEEGELNIKGHLYDVVRLKQVGISVYCYCLSDEAEEKLVQRLDDHVNDVQYRSPDKKENPDLNIYQNSLRDYFSSCKPDLLSMQDGNNMQWMKYSATLSEGFYSIHTPPPRRA